MFFKIGFLKNFAVFTGKTPVWELFNKVFNKMQLLHRCFPVNIAKLLRTPILKNICERLLLWFCSIHDSSFSGNHDEALSLLLPLMETRTKDNVLTYRIGTIYQTMGNYHDAVNYYQRLVEFILFLIGCYIKDS